MVRMALERRLEPRTIGRRIEEGQTHRRQRLAEVVERRMEAPHELAGRARLRARLHRIEAHPRQPGHQPPAPRLAEVEE